VALNVKIPLNKLNFIRDGVWLPVLSGTHPGNICSLNFERFWIGLPTVHLPGSEDMLIYPICRGATNSDTEFIWWNSKSQY
jgi:hypothetical protein